MSLSFHTRPALLKPILLSLFLLAWACVATVGAQVELVSTSAQRLSLIAGKSTLLRSPQAVKRISIGNPEIADFVLLSPTEIYLTGKAAGSTNLMLWNNGSVAAAYDLEVGYDMSTLQRQMRELLPEESGLKTVRMNDTIALSGTVSSADKLSQAMALARTFAPKEKVNNLVEVGGGHQVMLEVRVAELAKATTKRLGINFNYLDGDNFGVSMLGGLSSLVPVDESMLNWVKNQVRDVIVDSTMEAIDSIDKVTNMNNGIVGPLQYGQKAFPVNLNPQFGLNVSPNVQGAFRFKTGSLNWTTLIDALQTDGLAKVLAKPTLIAMSGQSANFLAGGEYPVPVPQGLGSVAIEYKEFGVVLNFTPVVLSNERIHLKVNPEVSELDFSTAIQAQGFVIPGLTKRRASTTIELGDGQSFAIAGLLSDNVRDVLHKFPLLGDIPVLGALFRSRSFQKSESELVIIVTPRLVKPIDADQTPLPTDFYKEPSDSDIYLNGVLQGKSGAAQAGSAPELAGEFGHSLPGGK
jgi:pilus assembly protein CpaC